LIACRLSDSALEIIVKQDPLVRAYCGAIARLGLHVIPVTSNRSRAEVS